MANMGDTNTTDIYVTLDDNTRRQLSKIAKANDLTPAQLSREILKDQAHRDAHTNHYGIVINGSKYHINVPQNIRITLTKQAQDNDITLDQHISNIIRGFLANV